MTEFMTILQSIIGGFVTGLIMVILYFLSIEKRLTRIETDITWLKKELPGCQQRSEKDTQ
jgi:hypothetical protein